MIWRTLLFLGVSSAALIAQARPRGTPGSIQIRCGAALKETIAPAVSISIDFHDNAGVAHTMKLAAGSGDQTVRVKWSDGFTITDEAHSPSGVSSLTLIPSWASVTGTIVEPMVATQLVSGHVCTATRTTQYTSLTAQWYRFDATAQNWAGAAGNSAKLTVMPLP